jgi:uncharacterized caspase-like protein
MTTPLPKVVLALFGALFLISAAALVPSVAFAGRFALVVSNEHYPEIGNLHFSHADGEIIGKTLVELNFEVEWVRDGSIGNVRQALSRIKQNAEAAGPDSVVFFYFSGHAAEDGARNYMILNERVPQQTAKLPLPDWKRANLPLIGLPYREVTSFLAALKTKASFAVIDSHYDLDEPELFEPGQVFATQGRPLLNAADSNNYSLALSSALLTPGLKVEDLFKRVQVRVAEVTNGRQIPFYANKIGEDFILNESGNPANGPSDVRAVVADEEQARGKPYTFEERKARMAQIEAMLNSILEEPLWISVKDSKDIQLLNVYLRRFPEGKHAAEAQNQINETTRLAAIAAKQAHPRGGSRLGRRVALVIGNSAYREADRLPNPVSDARGVAAALKGLGFETVQEGYDLGRDAMLKSLKSFGEAAKGADWAVVYYAGHGMEVKGTNYLIPIDAKLVEEEDVEEEAVPVSRLIDRLQDVAGIKVFILDACRDNPFATRMFRRRGMRGGGKGLAEIHADSGTLIAFATSPGDSALDGEGEHSPYAKALIDHLGDQGSEIRLMFGSVADSVQDATRKEQLPWISSPLGGKFYSFNPE